MLARSEVVCDALLCLKCKTGPLEQSHSTTESDGQGSYCCLDCHHLLSSELLSKFIEVSV